MWCASYGNARLVLLPRAIHAATRAYQRRRCTYGSLKFMRISSLSVYLKRGCLLRRLQSRRVRPLIKVGCRLRLARLLKHIVALRSRRQLRCFRSGSFRERGQPLLKRERLLERTPRRHSATPFDACRCTGAGARHCAPTALAVPRTREKLEWFRQMT